MAIFIGQWLSKYFRPMDEINFTQKVSYGWLLANRPKGMSLRCNGLIKAHGQQAQHSSFLKLFKNTSLSPTPRRAPWSKFLPINEALFVAIGEGEKTQKTLEITFSTTHLHLGS